MSNFNDNLLRREVQSLRTTAWIPIVEPMDGPPTSSKFSGTPYLKKDETYPVCPNCHLPMQLFVQLSLTELPEPLQHQFGEGLIQLFYCTTTHPLCEVQCEAYLPFAKSVVARLVQPDERQSTEASHGPEKPFPCKRIIGWEAVDDYPHWEDAERCGCPLTDEESEFLLNHNLPCPGDKLAGYPHWIQSAEYPSCPDCGEPMQLVFQIDSEVNLPYMFGDSGVGHLTQCPQHKHRLAFGWACC